ncbi:MAG: copper resistance protein CopC, partial [Acidimicrobiales bacterium]|nr:copper resistance protein CopC [Acidimicrobiales bacterium]
MRRALAAVLLAFGWLQLLALPAAAHATLKDTSPSNGAHLVESPKTVTLRFTEGVVASSGAVRLFRADGDTLAVGRPTHPAGEQSAVAVSLPKIGDGAYVVTWRVISEDSHPIQGAFTFVVGDAADIDDASVASLLQDRGGSRAVGVTYAMSRALAFGSMLLLVGGVVFLLSVWPDGRTTPGVRRALVVAFGVLVVTSVANLLLQGVYASGLTLADVVDRTVLSDVVATRFGRVYLVRFALLVLALPLLELFLRAERLGRWWPWVGGAIGLGLVATPGFAGHAAVGDYEPYALIADVAHVGAAAVWLGGLALLTLFVLPRKTDDLKSLVRRYSEVAFWSVTTLVATGLFQGWRQVGNVDALTSTPYGKLLIVKSAIVAGMLGVAWLSRRATRAKWTPDTTSRVRRTVGIETLAAVGVLVVTSMLVNAVPAKTIAAAPQSGELTSATLLVDYTLSPGRSGPNDIHLYTLTPAGQPIAVEEMTMTMSLPGS